MITNKIYEINIYMKIKINREDINNIIVDVTRILTQLMIVHFLTYVIERDAQLFDDKILKNMLYITLGVIFFYIFTKNITSLKKNKKKKIIE